MDNYPNHLAPINAGDSDQEPFSEWWMRVQCHYPHVSEKVAEQWIHRHWYYSNYGWIPSVKVRFELLRWHSNKLTSVQTGDKREETFTQWGKRLCRIGEKQGSQICWVASYMIAISQIESVIGIIERNSR